MINLGLSRAYEHLSWTYLLHVLQAFHFEPRWIQWISSLISSLVFSILLNGSPTQTFNASQELKQGELIYPFQFILATESLGRYIKTKVQEGQFKGLCLWGNDIPLIH